MSGGEALELAQYIADSDRWEALECDHEDGRASPALQGEIPSWAFCRGAKAGKPEGQSTEAAANCAVEDDEPSTTPDFM